jgi:hypothetical protein
MADTAKRLAGPVALTGAGATYYTVPALTTTIVRNIHVVNTDPTVAYTLTLGINGVAAANALYFTYQIPPGGTLDWSGFLVLATTDTIQALASTTLKLTLTISGIEAA